MFPLAVFRKNHFLSLYIHEVIQFNACLYQMSKRRREADQCLGHLCKKHLKVQNS